MSLEPKIYLDANASAPIRPEVLSALEAWIGETRTKSAWGNPSSVHSHGRRSKRLIAEAKEKVCRAIGDRVDPEQLVFTSSGTEANQLAIRSVLEPRLKLGIPTHWILSPVEHDSVFSMVEWAEELGARVSFCAVDESGRPLKESILGLLRPETALVSSVWVNNETGVITEWEDLPVLLRARDVRLHVDAAQAWGKVSIDAMSFGADSMSFSGHKIGAPAGAGALWVRPGVQISPLILGKQDKGRRGGTESSLGIFLMGEAAQHVDPASWSARLAPARDALEKEILARFPACIVNGAGASRVANTSSFSFDGVDGQSLVMALDLMGYSASAGSACSSGALEPSRILLALGRSRAQAMASLRISLAEPLSEGQIQKLTEDLQNVISRSRRAQTEVNPSLGGN